MLELDSWHSYPSVYALGHAALTELFLDSVLVEEKIDGSQFSFGLFADGYRARSKGAQLNLIAPEKMFIPAVEIIQSLPLISGWTYRAEYMLKPKHNALAYDRIPTKHLIIFDINVGHEKYLVWDAKAEEATRLGLEIVPRLYEGLVTDIQHFRTLLETRSVLGGQKVEGVVIKNYHRYGLDKKVLMGKFVSEAFKEVHAAEWKASNPASTDIVEGLITMYRTPARWQKALQHLRESGQIEDSPRDIGMLMREVPPDVEKECEQEIKAKLWAWAWPKIRRGIIHGLPEWYKDELLKKQFNSS